MNDPTFRFKPKYINILFLMILIGLLSSNIFYVVLKVTCPKSKTLVNIPSRNFLALVQVVRAYEAWSDVYGANQVTKYGIRKKIKHGMKLNKNYQKNN